MNCPPTLQTFWHKQKIWLKEQWLLLYFPIRYSSKNEGWSSDELSMQRVNTIVNTCLKLWNELPKYVKSSKTLDLFKKNISRVFLSAN